MPRLTGLFTAEWNLIRPFFFFRIRRRGRFSSLQYLMSYQFVSARKSTEPLLCFTKARVIL